MKVMEVKARIVVLVADVGPEVRVIRLSLSKVMVEDRPHKRQHRQHNRKANRPHSHKHLVHTRKSIAVASESPPLPISYKP